MPSPLNRRDALRLVAVAAAGGALMSQKAFAQETSGETGGLMPGADVCVLTPATTQGPYYFDPALERADITEGTQEGVATTVRLQVVDGSCKPIEGARVDIWHCNAEGLYSGYPGQTGGIDTSGQTFLRGTQFAGPTGIVEFQTIYPGWYPGRTTHIHFMVYLNERTALTGQLFFPDALSQFLYQTVPPYSDRGAERDVMNSNDNIARQASRASFAYVKEMEESYLVAMIIGVDPNAAR
ncbi:MAG: Intradiol ring-cleavage dioxygenase [Devosia sp.]|uniref:intradiol ring-cleavage dioxygenase n=1 Tax=Devosia sp. TaxID=1871048 RepID=UPI00260DCF5F|nr:intradiol ring-cleavage dioxygenase [Devosia sp.]MDB5542153.1 Intradiol ring-cleavage dioxygenase [Devosia sp.]